MSQIATVIPATLSDDPDEGRAAPPLDAALELLHATVTNLLADDLGELGRTVQEARAAS